MAIEYPSNLPDFRISKKRTQQQTFITSEPFSGPMFIEQRTDESPVSWDVTITCTSQTQSRVFQAFLRKVKGGLIFTKAILTEEGHVDHEVRFIVEPLRPNQLSSFHFEYSGTIYARALVQNDAIIDDDLIIEWLDDASLLDIIVNETWITA